MASAQQQFREVSQALNATGIFSGGGALIQYNSETDDQYSKRQQVSWYVNDIRPACMRFVGYLTKRPALRQTENAALQAILDDADWRGNSIDVFFQSFMLEAKARGSMLLLVDMPNNDQTAERPFPYFSAIAPEQVSKYTLTDQGRIESIDIIDTIDGKAVTRYFDEMSWKIIDGEGNILQQGEHNLGLCPVVAFTESGEYPCIGEFAAIVGLSKRLINLRSELDEILRRHTFPIFSAQFPILDPIAGEMPESLQARQVSLIAALKDAVANLGKDRGIVSPSSVGFVAPPDTPAQTYRDVIKDIEEKVAEIGFNTNQSGEKSAESGLALTIRFQALNAALTAFARRMEDFERMVFYVAGRWLGIDADAAYSAQWSRDYQIADVTTELSTLDALAASNFPQEVIDEQMRTIVQLLFTNRTPAVFDAILESIGSAEVRESENESDD